MTRWLFSMVCFRGPEENRVQTTEHISAETWAQALEFWESDMSDESTEIISITKQVPIIACRPIEKRQ